MGSDELADIHPHDHQLHVFFFPHMPKGHMIPMVDIARLFAARGLRATIVSTPGNATAISEYIYRDRSSGLDIDIQIIPFPGVEVGLPEGTETLDKITSPEMIPKIFMAVKMLQQPFEKLLEKHKPDFVVADMFLHWTTESGGKFGIPRIVFNVCSFFSQCVSESIASNKPYQGLTDDIESFVVPGLPDKIEMLMSQLSPQFKLQNAVSSELLDPIRESELKSYGVLVNSVYELEPAYAEHHRKVMGRKAWPIGPVLVPNRDTASQRGKKGSIDENYIVNWLDSKKPNSVLYISFGSIYRFSNEQLLEMAMSLEDLSSGQFSFIWVAKTIKHDEVSQRFLPEGFEKRMEGKVLIIRDWAPQVLILEHPAVGGFMNSCGWNSMLESLSAGVPMITWPLFADQFINEKFATQLLQIGIGVGANKWNMWADPNRSTLVKKEKIVKVVSQLMGDGEEAQEMRKRARKLSEMVKKAVEEGGSSYANLTSLVEEMKIYKKQS